MIRKIVLYNEAHIGDILFSQKMVKNISENNPQYKFFYRIKYNYFLFKDIPTVEAIGLDKYPELDNMRKVPFCMLDDETLMINIWIGAMEHDYTKRNFIACNGWKLCYTLKEKLASINDIFKTDLKMVDYDVTEALPTYPKTDITKFLNWKKENTKKTIFFYNYLPMSGQIMPVADQNKLVIDLAKKYSDCSVIVSKHTEVLSITLKNNGINNVFFCENDFGCKETIDCENLCRISEIVGECDISIHLEIGACFYYCNSGLLSTHNNILQISNDSQWYNQFKFNYEKEEYEKRVNLLICQNNEDVDRQLFPKIDALLGRPAVSEPVKMPDISYSLTDSKGIPIDFKLDTLFMKSDGFFVDVGAHNGLCQSNTAFFERHRGWKGICVEPSLSAFVECVKNRPSSRVLNYACVSNDYGKSIVKGDFDSNLMSSIDGKRLGREISVAVPSRTLDRILETQKVTHIDFLNIDVSGYEKEMLGGLTLGIFRPKYILIEILRHNYDDVMKYFSSNDYVLIANITNFGPPVSDGSHNDYLFKDKRD